MNQATESTSRDRHAAAARSAARAEAVFRARAGDAAGVLGHRAIGSLRRDLMARLVRSREPTATVARRWVGTSLELVRRLVRDYDAIARRLGPRNEAPGRVVAIDAGLGDPHRGGRRVMGLTFASGARVIYKPRPVGLASIWGDLVEWLCLDDPSGPRMPALVQGGGYGWIERLPVETPATPSAMRQFYRRAGRLLSLLDVFEVKDAHAGNLIASAGHPVLVDAETLAHPRFPSWTGTPSLVLTGFMPWTGGGRFDLPARHAGVMAGRGTGGLHPARFAAELIEGYRQGYRRLLRHGATLAGPAGPLERLRAERVRVVVRPTRQYARAARRGPGAWPPVSGRSPELSARATARLVRAERRALARGDVPIFEARGGGRDLLAGRVTVATRCFPRSGADAVLDRLASLCPADQHAMTRLIGSLLSLDAARRSDG